MPYLDDFWREHLTERYIDHAPFTLASYAPALPQSARQDWRPAKGVPGADLDALRAHALDAFGTRFAIANMLHGAVALFNADMAAALCKAVNSWIAREWLDREPRLRASILVPPQDVELAVAEIERCAVDRRFVQVLLLVMGGTAARPSQLLADLSCRRKAITCRSVCMRVLDFPPCADRLRPGRPITSRTASCSRAPSSRTRW